MRSYNRIHRPQCVDIKGDITEITVYNTKNEEFKFKIDTTDLPKVSEYKWSVKTNPKGNKCKYYFQTRCGNSKLMLHHLIIGKPKNGKIVDHINIDQTDNRKSNLRFVSRSRNNINQGIRKDNPYGCRNVTYHKSKEKYAVTYSVNGKPKHFKYFKELDIARRYANMIRRMYYGPETKIF